MKATIQKFGFRRWLLINGSFGVLLVAAVLLEEQARWLANIAIFAVWVMLGVAFFTALGFVALNWCVNLSPPAPAAEDYEAREAYQRLRAKQETLLESLCNSVAEPPISRTVDVAFDVAILGLLVGHGWWVTGVAYLLCTLLQQNYWVYRKRWSERRWERIAAALKIGR